MTTQLINRLFFFILLCSNLLIISTKSPIKYFPVTGYNKDQINFVRELIQLANQLNSSNSSNSHNQTSSNATGNSTPPPATNKQATNKATISAMKDQLSKEEKDEEKLFSDMSVSVKGMIKKAVQQFVIMKKVEKSIKNSFNETHKVSKKITVNQVKNEAIMKSINSHIIYQLRMQLENQLIALEKVVVECEKQVELVNLKISLIKNQMPLMNSACGHYGGCSSCVADPKCGWCSMTQTCMEGSANGAKDGSCMFFDYGQCSGPKDCSEYNDCQGCLRDPSCGWCNRPGSPGCMAKNAAEKGICKESIFYLLNGNLNICPHIVLNTEKAKVLKKLDNLKYGQITIMKHTETVDPEKEKKLRRELQLLEEIKEREDKMLKNYQKDLRKTVEELEMLKEDEIDFNYYGLDPERVHELIDDMVGKMFEMMKSYLRPNSSISAKFRLSNLPAKRKGAAKQKSPSSKTSSTPNLTRKIPSKEKLNVTNSLRSANHSNSSISDLNSNKEGGVGRLANNSSSTSRPASNSTISNFSNSSSLPRLNSTSASNSSFNKNKTLPNNNITSLTTNSASNSTLKSNSSLTTNLTSTSNSKLNRKSSPTINSTSTSNSTFNNNHSFTSNSSSNSSLRLNPNPSNNSNSSLNSSSPNTSKLNSNLTTATFSNNSNSSANGTSHSNISISKSSSKSNASSSLNSTATIRKLNLEKKNRQPANFSTNSTGSSNLTISNKTSDQNSSNNFSPNNTALKFNHSKSINLTSSNASETNPNKLNHSRTIQVSNASNITNQTSSNGNSNQGPTQKIPSIRNSSLKNSSIINATSKVKRQSRAPIKNNDFSKKASLAKNSSKNVLDVKNSSFSNMNSNNNHSKEVESGFKSNSTQNNSREHNNSNLKNESEILRLMAIFDKLYQNFTEVIDPKVVYERYINLTTPKCHRNASSESNKTSNGSASSLKRVIVNGSAQILETKHVTANRNTPNHLNKSVKIKPFKNKPVVKYSNPTSKNRTNESHVSFAFKNKSMSLRKASNSSSKPNISSKKKNNTKPVGKVNKTTLIPHGSDKNNSNHSLHIPNNNSATHPSHNTSLRNSSLNKANTSIHQILNHSEHAGSHFNGTNSESLKNITNTTLECKDDTLPDKSKEGSTLSFDINTFMNTDGFEKMQEIEDENKDGSHFNLLEVSSQEVANESRGRFLRGNN